MIEYTDRYGGPENWPDPDTVCKGPCEGMGVYPTGRYLDVKFVTCEECGGTGKRTAEVQQYDGQEATDG